jgi:hypothetical protein
MKLSMLRPLYDRPGPWASVFVDASHNTEGATPVIELRWRSARETLTTAGCDPVTLDALERAVLSHPLQPGRHGMAAFAAQGEVILTRSLSAPPWREIAVYGPLPHTMPLVAQLGEEISYVRVVVDHTGADVTVAGPGRLVRSETVQGSAQFPIRKANAGGWRHRRQQQAVQESWRRNARDAATAVAELAESYDAEIIVVAGEPRSRPMLVDGLPERWHDRVVVTDAGGRAAGADPSSLDDVTIQTVAERAAEHEESILDRYRTQRGRGAAASDGLPAVVAALQRGQVEAVLLVDDPSSTEELWIGPGPLELSYDPAELHVLNVPDPQRVRADAAVIRALACTDATLTLVGPDELPVDGGIAALLRYADAGTRHR